MVARQRDVWLAQVPFMDSGESKRRPVLVITGTVFNSQQPHVLAMSITTNLDNPLPGISLAADDFEAGGLPRASRVLTSIVFPIPRDQLQYSEGRLATRAFQQVVGQLLEALH